MRYKNKVDLMRFSLVAMLALLLVTEVAQAQQKTAAADPRPEMLKALDGNWIMSGDVKGKSVIYDMSAAPTLQGTFTEMHMLDTQVPAKYEARVFIGYDQGTQVVIAHWMDSFGAKYSIPHATGVISGNTIQFVFPYESARFRDTFTYDAAKNSWRFVIEASQLDGSWKHFAHYDVRRK